MKFIFEAYDGIAVLTTVDPQAGIVVLNIAPGCEADVEAVMADLKKQMIIEPVERDIGNARRLDLQTRVL